MGGGAWPFLVGGAICLVNSVNERDLSLLTSYVEVCDALRCSGPHARYTDVFNESIALADRPGGRRSRNKVSVGEPAEGSLSKPHKQCDPRICLTCEGWLEVFGSSVPLVSGGAGPCAVGLLPVEEQKPGDERAKEIEINPVNHRVFERKLRPEAIRLRARLPGCRPSLPHCFGLVLGTELGECWLPASNASRLVEN
ncbi:hypothetical protein RIF29_02128 [Crotalaria pallida]|uniref:Uncharacterized protein n=1 Tax=Crotalaria pallida TaxID=3830 RepID=A0AAN9IY60_CROPI